MSPSPGDALVCCVKKCGVLAENKKRLRRRQLLPTTTLAAFLLVVVAGGRSRFLVFAAVLSGSPKSPIPSQPAITAAQFTHSPQRREHCRHPLRDNPSVCLAVGRFLASSALFPVVSESSGHSYATGGYFVGVLPVRC